MSDRLSDLQRQRALAQEQLAWFDREIARETGSPVPPTAPVGVTGPRPPVPEAAIVDRDAEKILERFRHAGHPVKDEVKRGCFIYFFAAFGLMILGLTVFWLLRRR